MLRTHEQISSRLAALGIDHRKPGFYDHQEFVAQERVSPEFLEEYAQFVATLPTTADYVARVLRDVPVIAGIVHRELVADGRLGACIDIGMILSRILEQEEIWNVQVKGSLTVDFQNVSSLPKQYYWSVDQTAVPFAAAHSWLVVPPYSVVDVALKQQPYRRGREYIPTIVLSQSRERAPFQIERIISPEIRSLAARAFGKATADGLAEHFAPAWLRMRDVLPPVVIDQEGIQLTYDAVAIGAPDAPFEQMVNWPVNGRLGLQLYRELIAPALQVARGDSTT